MSCESGRKRMDGWEELGELASEAKASATETFAVATGVTFGAADGSTVGVAHTYPLKPAAL